MKAHKPTDVPTLKSQSCAACGCMSCDCATRFKDDCGYAARVVNRIAGNRGVSATRRTEELAKLIDEIRCRMKEVKG